MSAEGVVIGEPVVGSLDGKLITAATVVTAADPTWYQEEPLYPNANQDVCFVYRDSEYGIHKVGPSTYVPGISSWLGGTSLFWQDGQPGGDAIRAMYYGASHIYVEDPSEGSAELNATVEAGKALALSTSQAMQVIAHCRSKGMITVHERRLTFGTTATTTTAAAPTTVPPKADAHAKDQGADKDAIIAILRDMLTGVNYPSEDIRRKIVREGRCADCYAKLAECACNSEDDVD